MSSGNFRVRKIGLENFFTSERVSGRQKLCRKAFRERKPFFSGQNIGDTLDESVLAKRCCWFCLARAAQEKAVLQPERVVIQLLAECNPLKKHISVSRREYHE